MPFSFRFSSQFGGDPVSNSSIIPRKRTINLRGIRFANKKAGVDYEFGSAESNRVNSTVNVLFESSDKNSLSGVIGNRFANRRPLIPKGGFFIDPNPPSSAPSLFRSAAPIPFTSAGPLGINRVYTVPFPFPSDAANIAISGSNRMYNAGVGADVTSSMAVYTSDGTGNPSTPSLLDFTLALPGDGRFATQALGNLPLGVDNKLVFLYNFPDPIFGHGLGTDLGNYTESNLTVDPPPTITGPNSNPNFWFDFSYETRKRKIVVLGDSISGGYTTGGSVGFLSASWNLFAAENDCAVSIQSVVQYGSLLTFGSPGTYPFLWDTLSDIVPGNEVVIQLGTNDLNYNDLPTMLTALQAIIAKLQTLGSGPIYAWTIPPQAGYPGTEVARTGFNSTVLSTYVSLGIAGVYDAAASRFAGGIADVVDPSLMDGLFDSGDLTHPNLAGQVQIKNGWRAVLP
jgi:lysophospholipase L1-like esterase